MVIVGVIDGGKDYLVRLAGTKLVEEFFGADPTGSMLSQILRDDEFSRRSHYIVDEARRRKRFILNQPGRARLRQKDYMTLETVTVPLVDEAGAVVKVASLYDYFFQSADAPP